MYSKSHSFPKFVSLDMSPHGNVRDRVGFPGRLAEASHLVMSLQRSKPSCGDWLNFTQPVRAFFQPPPPQKNTWDRDCKQVWGGPH